MESLLWVVTNVKYSARDFPSKAVLGFYEKVNVTYLNSFGAILTLIKKLNLTIKTTIYVFTHHVFLFKHAANCFGSLKTYVNDSSMGKI